jgi:hypothetical protein
LFAAYMSNQELRSSQKVKSRREAK